MRLPDFLIVGAPKCGTTTMHEILKQHSQIFLPTEKEIHFFDNNKNFSKGINWYKNYFKNIPQDKIAGDITPSYMYYDYAVKRIHETFGTNVKIIFMLRNPADRAFSEYSYNLSRGLIKEQNFEKALKLEFINKDLPPFEKRYFSFISRGYYGYYIQIFFQYFPDKNLHFVLFEDEFLKDPEKCVKELQEFLGIKYEKLNTDLKSNTGFVPHYPGINKLIYDPNPIRSVLKKMIPVYTLRKEIKDLVKEINSNKKAKQAKLSKEVKNNLLQEYYQRDIIETEKLISKDLSSWTLK